MNQMKITNESPSRGPKKKLRDHLALHIYILPNLLTTGNMFFGFYSIIASMKGDYLMASYAIIASAIFDLLDGRVARLTHSVSDFGEHLDSLSDLISFGIAPAILVYKWALEPFGRIGWIAGFMYLACAALRLARYNVQIKNLESKDFQGLPTPMAGGIIASGVMAFNELHLTGERSLGILIITFLLGIVMVSQFKYRSFRDVDFRQRMPFRYLVIGLAIFVIVATWPEVMLFVLFLTYTIFGAIFGLMNWGRKSRAGYIPEKPMINTDLLENIDK